MAMHCKGCGGVQIPDADGDLWIFFNFDWVNSNVAEISSVGVCVSMSDITMLSGVY